MINKTVVRDTITVDEDLQKEVATALDQVADRTFAKVTVEINDGDRIRLPSQVADLVHQVLLRAAQGGEIMVRTMPKILTTSTAAGILGISRSMVMKLIRDGELKHHKVGAHHRVEYADVIELKAKREIKRAQAVQKLLELDD